MALTADTPVAGNPAAPARGAAGALDVRLDAALPESVAVGAGTALFVCGTCFSPRGAVSRPRLVVDGEEQELMATAMPRMDLFQALHPALDPLATHGLASDPDSPDDPRLSSYRSGFWGLARLRPGGPARRELLLRAEVDGITSEAVLARPEEIALPRPLELEGTGEGPLVAVCMATHEPPPDLFRAQLDSIRAQTHGNWVCVISDDGSSPRARGEIEAAIGDDPRFVLSPSPRRLGFYRNFERALALAPRNADHVTMADQDDRWHADKLESLLGALGGARLAYSDQRIVTSEGETVAESYWGARRNNHTSLTSLLVANSVTGAASLLPRALLDDALPFPPSQFAHFHDHWIGLCALSLGDVAYVDRPLYDYVQHGDAVLGHAAANVMPSLRSRLARVREDPRERIRRWRMTFFVDNCRLAQFATVLEMRCGERMPPAKRRELRRWLRAERSPAAQALLLARAVRELGGRTETLGAELGLLFGFTWRRLVALSARRGSRPRPGPRLEAVPPPSLAPKPGRRAPDSPGPRAIFEKTAPLELAVDDAAPERVNVLIPTLDLTHFFGGYIGKFNLARRLAERGLRVRIVTVDPTPPLPRGWSETIEAYAGLEGMFDRVEVALGREAQGLEVSRGDRFVATTWWTAHIADAATRRLRGEGGFVYLIQEYEPFTFEMGSWAALAEQSYRLPHFGLFSTELLRDFFRRRGIGVFAGGVEAGDAGSASFQNAITAVPAPAASELAARAAPRLLFYARPEPHAARNMFELGVLALDRALERGAFAGWELHGIGSVESGSRISLGGGASLRVLPRSRQSSYAEVLRDHDVGLALMFTPHPSLVPIEMASAGMLAVTNTYENKTADALAAISPNLIAAEPDVDGIADALLRAARDAGDHERRAAGAAATDWARDWDTAFGDELVDRLAERLRA